MRSNRTIAAPGATVYVEVAIVPSSSSYGASTIYSKVYRKGTLGSDEVVLDLVGGRFLVVGGQAFPVRFTEPTRHPFERGGNEDVVPASAVEGPYRDGMFPGLAEIERLDSPPSGARPWGGLPDWVVS